MLGWGTPNDDPTDERYAFVTGGRAVVGRAALSLERWLWHAAQCRPASGLPC